MEPLYKGQVGGTVPWGEAVLFSELEVINVEKWKFGGLQLVLCSEVVLFSEAPLSEVPLYLNGWSLMWLLCDWMVVQMERRVWERGRGSGKRGALFERKAESACPHWHALTSPVQVLHGRQGVWPV